MSLLGYYIIFGTLVIELLLVGFGVWLEKRYDDKRTFFTD